jgi:Bacterial archaeo-eukaryotic release factor family 2
MKLRFLRPLYSEVGRYVSVYLDTSRAHENAPGEVELRWRAARERLAESGADGATVDAAGAVLTDPGRAAPGRAVFARDGAVKLTAALAAPPRREIARFAPLPHVMPMLAQQPARIPHLRVTANRAGGEVVAVSDHGDVWPEGAARRDWPVHKVATGGWSQARYQRSAEEAWEENAKELASVVSEAVARAGAETIVIGGDVRARSLVLRHLNSPPHLEILTVEEEVPADSDVMAEAAEKAICAHAEQQARERFDHWQVQRGHGAAVGGLADTLPALADGKVADLFVADRPSSTATAWIDPGSGDLAVSESTLRERGASQPVADRADAAMVRSLAATDAELFFLPEDLVQPGEPGEIDFPRDGVCATLRWPDEA